MGSNFDNVANLSLDDPPPKPSFFSRLAAPLRSRSRNLADFHVRLKEPHRKYSAGDHVQGTIVLSVVKPIRITHLTVALHGYVRAFKNASAAAQLATANPAIVSHGPSNGRYHGNGHASLFQDEIVLCGEGRLQASRWEFEFNLQFPDLELPSSIDFERGTIGYFVTATLTRPSAIGPISSCEARVSLVEKVDVGLIAPPRERKVFLQTMKRRAKKGKSLAPTTSLTGKNHSVITDLADQFSDRSSARITASPSGSAINLGNARPTSLDSNDITPTPGPIDGRSEISGESAASNNSAPYSLRATDTSGGSTAGSGRSGHDDREITATVELLKGGCIPGELVPVRIRVEHNRYMKSLHGIIVTLYRQGRVDYAPPISSFTGLTKEEAKKLERDDYYPRSKTGLGGLSLSSAGSCSVFRKDLSQAVAPLIIDPTTFTANITTAVRIPEDAFPSIRNVPGGLITFKYHIEVIVDLGGKLVGPSNSTSQSQNPNRMGPSASSRAAYGIDLNVLSNWNGTMIDTDHIRREKGVISLSFEVVVGTTDSSKLRGKAVARPPPVAQTLSPHGEVPHEDDAYHYDWANTYHDEPGDHQENNRGNYPQPPPQPQAHYFAGAQTAHYDFQTHEALAPVYVPPPAATEEGDLTDKERVRRAELQLLPSQPSLPTPESTAGPSQPLTPNATQYPPAQGSSINLPPVEEPSAPALGDLEANFLNHGVSDKQELERQRLLAEASAPPDMPNDYEGAEPSAPISDTARSGPWFQEPSAPHLDEDHVAQNGYDYQGIVGMPTTDGPPEPLPRYQR